MIPENHVMPFQSFFFDIYQLIYVPLLALGVAIVEDSTILITFQDFIKFQISTVDERPFFCCSQTSRLFQVLDRANVRDQLILHGDNAICSLRNIC